MTPRVPEFGHPPSAKLPPCSTSAETVFNGPGLYSTRATWIYNVPSNSGRVSITNAAEIALKDKDSQIRVLTLTDDDIVREAARLKRERKIKKAVQPSAKTRADLFAGLSAELPLNREVEFERLIDAAISAIAQLDKIVADAIWDLRFSDSKKVKAGINKYCDEVDRLPTHLKTVLTAVSPPDVVNRGTSSS